MSKLWWVSLYCSLLMVAGGASAQYALQAEDVPNDDGTGLHVRWTVPQGFQGTDELFTLNRRDAAQGEEKFVAKVAVGDGLYTDKSLTADGQYWYSLKGKDGGGNAVEFAGGPFAPAAQWFNVSKLNTLAFIVILTVCILYFIHLAKTGQSLFIRKIAGLDELDDAVGRATEMGRPVFHVPGIGTISDIATLASLSIMRRVAKRVAEYNVPFVVPCTEPLVMTMAQEVVKTAYAEAGRPELYKAENVSYLTYDQFGFAAGVDGMMMRDKPGAVLLLGYFMAESLIMAETGNAIGAIQIAGTDQTSQLPFFVAACDYTLIGEELYAASSYLSREPVFLGSLKGQDLVKVIILSAIALGVGLSCLAVLLGHQAPVLQKVADVYSEIFKSVAPAGGD